MQVGDRLYDMQGTNFSDPELHMRYTIGIGALEWIDDYGPHGNAAVPRFDHMLNRIMTAVGSSYTDKSLVVIGEALSTESRWYIAAYCSEGRRCGMCKIRERLDGYVGLERRYLERRQ